MKHYRWSLERVRNKLSHWDHAFESVLLVLSALAVLLVFANEVFPTRDLKIPLLDLDWATFTSLIRIITWSTFLFVFILQGLSSDSMPKYIRAHWLELIICATWVPFPNTEMVRHLHDVFSVQMLSLVGSVIHLVRVVQWVGKRFNANPLIVIGSAATIMVLVASAILTQVEPATFPNMVDAMWFCIQTVFTVGYGDIAPKSSAGRTVAGLLIIGGTGLVAVFIGFVSRYVQQRLLNQEHDDMVRLIRQVDTNNKLIAQLLDENRESHELNKRLLQDNLVEHELNRLLLQKLDAANPGNSNVPESAPQA